MSAPEPGRPCVCLPARRPTHLCNCREPMQKQAAPPTVATIRCGLEDTAICACPLLCAGRASLCIEPAGRASLCFEPFSQASACHNAEVCKPPQPSSATSHCAARGSPGLEEPAVHTPLSMPLAPVQFVHQRHHLNSATRISLEYMLDHHQRLAEDHTASRAQ